MRAKVKYWLAPGLPSVELTAGDFATQRFTKHWHMGFSIGVVVRNSQFFHANGHAWHVGPGDVILLNPGQVHDGYAIDPEGWSSRMAYVPEASWSRLVGAPGQPVVLRFDCPVISSPVLASKFLEWHRMTEVVSDVMSHALTSDLFAAIAALMTQVDEAPDGFAGGHAPDLFGRMLALAGSGHAAVEDLNEELHLSRYGSWRRVTREFGLAPKPLLAQLRLIKAKRLLAEGCPVIDTALDCGYHDQSHFTNRFAAAYGFTPAQFRRAQLAKGA